VETETLIPFHETAKKVSTVYWVLGVMGRGTREQASERRKT
jgi:hypothetical protein